HHLDWILAGIFDFWWFWLRHVATHRLAKQRQEEQIEPIHQALPEAAQGNVLQRDDWTFVVNLVAQTHFDATQFLTNGDWRLDGFIEHDLSDEVRGLAALNSAHQRVLHANLHFVGRPRP